MQSQNLEMVEKYKGYVIKSAPYKCQNGDYSSNGVIEIHTGNDVTIVNRSELQAKYFKKIDDAHDFFINAARKIIDSGNL